MANMVQFTRARYEVRFFFKEIFRETLLSLNPFLISFVLLAQYHKDRDLKYPDQADLMMIYKYTIEVFRIQIPRYHIDVVRVRRLFLFSTHLLPDREQGKWGCENRPSPPILKFLEPDIRN